MGVFTSDVKNLRELYITKLQHTLSSERQIADKGLPAMVEKATNPQLQQAFRKHLEETREHVSRIEQILSSNKGDASDSKCKITAALISAADSEIGDAANENIRDVILIAAGNQIEHFEIAEYGTLRTWAKILGQQQDVTLLERTLGDEHHADELLTQLSQQINVAAPVA